MTYYTKFQWYGAEREKNAQSSDIFLKLVLVLVLVSLIVQKGMAKHE